MSLDYENAYQDIIGKLKELTGVTVLEVEDDNQVKRSGTEVLPYVVVNLGGPMRSATDRGICGSARDTNQFWLVLTCVSTNVGIARKLKNDVISKLVDYEPTDAGPITLDGGFRQNIASTSTMPKRYAEVVMMGFRHNLKV